jgi:ribosome-associated protein
MNNLSRVENDWREWLTAQKVENIEVHSLLGVSDFVDEMLLGTAMNTRHLTHLAEDAMQYGKGLDVSLIAADGLNNREWIVLDFGVYMIHLMLPEIREKLRLEDLYKSMKFREMS